MAIVSPPRHWLDQVRRDPVPWLLDPGNPSVRWMMLRDVFHKPPAALAEAQQQIAAWPPVQTWLQHWLEPHFWGRRNNPYYGGAVGNFGVLYLFAQLGVPRIAQVEPVCENLLAMGLHNERGFSPNEGPASPWMCYTGMSLFLLRHFGYQDDPRFHLAWDVMLHSLLHRSERLSCPIAGGGCPAGWTKLLLALLALPEAERNAEEREAIVVLATRLLEHPYDFKGWDRDWLAWAFPRYYDSDLIELCHALVRTPLRDHPRFTAFLELLVESQTEEGVWHKRRNTPVLPLERIYHPSRWLTFEAVHTLMLQYGDPIYAA